MHWYNYSKSITGGGFVIYVVFTESPLEVSQKRQSDSKVCNKFIDRKILETKFTRNRITHYFFQNRFDVYGAVVLATLFPREISHLIWFTEKFFSMKSSARKSIKVISIDIDC